MERKAAKVMGRRTKGIQSWLRESTHMREKVLYSKAREVSISMNPPKGLKKGERFRGGGEERRRL